MRKRGVVHGKGTVAHVQDAMSSYVVDAFIDNPEKDCVVTDICKRLPIGTKVSITVEVLE
jgi:hypothetical protein